ncbi:GNAT family N-acetyltransferase [Peribacillus simplex]|uniref:GNAT family N-acetyltransferase n=1 Tax=Peribacillus simplex TaxID=1478 RepID=UPI0024E1ECAB|nr:GNAT family N-acetyltransferase [Peribacillus simplex]MDF9758694.1 RimJ/RimL family protein N-acetyltransferase [Peribacillus simplex]MDM5292318.1 GNAT family N-acetyltransferase [Peribacillus simplex]
MEKVNFVELKHFSDEYSEKLNQFELPEEQGLFTALPNKFTDVTKGQHRIVILSDDEPVGFFLLHSTDRVKEYSTNPNAMLLTALSVDYKQQGKGYAKQGMLLLDEFVKSEFPNCDEIVLAVNHKNIPAQKLYVRAGFHDTGLRKFGNIGEQYIMNLTI